MIRNHYSIDVALRATGPRAAEIEKILRHFGADVPADAVVLHATADCPSVAGLRQLMRRLHPEARAALDEGPLTAVVTTEFVIAIAEAGLRGQPAQLAALLTELRDRSRGVPILVLASTGTLTGHADYAYDGDAN